MLERKGRMMNARVTVNYAGRAYYEVEIEGPKIFIQDINRVLALESPSVLQLSGGGCHRLAWTSRSVPAGIIPNIKRRWPTQKISWFFSSTVKAWMVARMAETR